MLQELPTDKFIIPSGHNSDKRKQRKNLLARMSGVGAEMSVTDLKLI